MTPCKIFHFVHLLARCLGSFESWFSNTGNENYFGLAQIRGYNLENYLCKQAGSYLQCVCEFYKISSLFAMFTFLMLDCYVNKSKNTDMQAWLVWFIQKLSIVRAR